MGVRLLSALLGEVCWRAYLRSLLRESLRELFSGGVFGKFSESVSGERFSGGVLGVRVWGAIFGRRFQGGSLGVLFVDLLWNIYLTDCGPEWRVEQRYLAERCGCDWPLGEAGR